MPTSSPIPARQGDVAVSLHDAAQKLRKLREQPAFAGEENRKERAGIAYSAHLVEALARAAEDDHLAGLLAEQNHTYFDLDHDSACCPDRRFACRNYLPHGEVTA